VLHYGRIVLLSILFLGCSFSETNPDNENVLARINDLTVSVPHFENAFKEYFYRTGQVLTPSESTKKAILDSEFNTYVLAVHARDLGLDDTEEARFQELAIQKRVLTEEFLEQLVFNEIQVTEQDLQEYFLRFNTRLRASHIYAETKEEAYFYYERLKAGETFDALAEEAFTNQYLSDNGGDIGWFTTDELDVSFEETAFNLNQDEFSEPVKTAQGYSIIKVTDSRVRPFITQQEFGQNKSRLESYVRKKKEELVKRDHLSNFVNEVAITQEYVDDLLGIIQESEEQWLVKDPEFVNNISNLDGEVAKFGDFKFGKDAFIEEYYASSSAMLNSVVNRATLENFIKGVAYRAYMIEEAEAAGLHEQEIVKSSIKETYLHYLESLAIKEMQQSINNTPAELYTTFQDNRDKFTQPMQVNVQRLVVGSEEKADLMIRAFKSGETFDSLILNHSINNEDRLINGELGYKAIEEFGFNSEQLANLEVGEISSPINYTAGEIHIYKIVDKIEARPLTFDEAKGRVNAFLLQKKLGELRAETIQDVKLKHDARINTDLLNELTLKI
jgi:parvulin-like peptidyl-prolyl isomerase